MADIEDSTPEIIHNYRSNYKHEEIGGHVKAAGTITFDLRVKEANSEWDTKQTWLNRKTSNISETTTDKVAYIADPAHDPIKEVNLLSKPGTLAWKGVKHNLHMGIMRTLEDRTSYNQRASDNKEDPVLMTATGLTQATTMRIAALAGKKEHDCLTLARDLLPPCQRHWPHANINVELVIEDDKKYIVTDDVAAPPELQINKKATKMICNRVYNRAPVRKDIEFINRHYTYYDTAATDEEFTIFLKKKLKSEQFIVVVIQEKAQLLDTNTNYEKLHNFERPDYLKSVSYQNADGEYPRKNKMMFSDTSPENRENLRRFKEFMYRYRDTDDFTPEILASFDDNEDFVIAIPCGSGRFNEGTENDATAKLEFEFTQAIGKVYRFHVFTYNDAVFHWDDDEFLAVDL